MWSRTLVVTGRITPLKPSASSLAWSGSGSRSPSAPARRSPTCPCRSAPAPRRTPSTASMALTTPRMYSTWPTSSFGPVPWPLACTFPGFLDDRRVRLGAMLHRHRVVALGALADVLHIRLGAGPPHAVHLLARVAGGLRLLQRGGVHHAPAPQQHVVRAALAHLQPGGLLLHAGRRHRQQLQVGSRAWAARSCSSGIGSLPIRAVVVDQRDLLALELVQAAFLLADGWTRRRRPPSRCRSAGSST
jgi:hypothetical protein